MGCAAAAAAATVWPEERREANLLKRRFEDAYEPLEPERPLGVGGHGVVFPGVNKSSGEFMAIKQVSKKVLQRESEPKKLEALRQRVTNEAEMLRIAGEHRSICSYKEVFDEDEAWYIVTELARGGELFDRLVERGAYTAGGAASVMRELVDAVAYLHQMGIAHLDLKPENVLLASGETDASDVRLVDFGSARFLDTEETSETPRESVSVDGPAGATPAYAAPEVLRSERLDDKADIWSLGVILYLLLTGTHPFDPSNDADDRVVAQRVLQGARASGAFEGPHWARVPRAARPLMRRLLADDPNDRPSAAVVSAHPWLVDPESPAALALAEKEEEAVLDEASMQATVDKLREFHRGRRRLKALLLAVMLGHSDHALRLERGKGTACLGSRRAAMEVFDADSDGLVTHSDVQRVARYLGEELTRTEVDEMLRALDHHCRPRDERGVPTSRLRYLLPPLYPAHDLKRGDVVFSAGEVDPRFYVLLDGDVLVSHSFTLRPRQDRVLSPTPLPAPRSTSASRPFGGRELRLGLHRLQKGQSFGETELLEASVPEALPRASTATCASESCKLLSVPGHLFQLLSDVFDGVQEPLRVQAENRARGLVWAWVSALVAHSGDGDIASRASLAPDECAWANRAYVHDSPLGKSPDLLHNRAVARPPALRPRVRGLDRVEPSRNDVFLVVEDGLVVVKVADLRTGASRTHTLWPRDFVYCNERPGNHPLDAKQEFASTVIVDVVAATQAQLAFVHGDVFQQALNQPAMCVSPPLRLSFFLSIRFLLSRPLPRSRLFLARLLPSAGNSSSFTSSSASAKCRPPTTDHFLFLRRS